MTVRGLVTAMLFPSAAWFGTFEALGGPVGTMEGTARLAGIAGVLGTLTVLIYRLGVWRQEMEYTKHTVGAEVRAHREESTANFERLERRLEAIDHLVTAANEYRLRTSRWQARTERRLERLERRERGR
jgi:hypothetical protein